MRLWDDSLLQGKWVAWLDNYWERGTNYGSRIKTLRDPPAQSESQKQVIVTPITN